MAEEKGNIISSGLNLMNTAYNGAGGIVISGDAVKGGYFVTDTIDNIPSWSSVAGTLCYCTADSKFYQYNGSSWQEKNFGTTGATNNTTANRLFLIGAKNQADSQITYSDRNVYMQSGVLTTSSITTGGIKSSSSRLSLEVTSSDGITYNVADFVADSAKGTNATLSGYLTVSGDVDGSSTDKPTDQTGSSDLDTHYFNTGIALYNNDNGITHKLSFPAKSGTFATLDDTKIEIVDLTGN